MRARAISRRLHASGEAWDLPVRFLLQSDEGQQVLGQRNGGAREDIEVACVDDEVLQDRDLLVQVVLLGNHAHPGLDPAPLDPSWQAQHGEVAARGRGGRGDHPHGGGLACPVGPQEAEALGRLDVEFDAPNGIE